MADVRVKVCGITSPDDAVACHRLGADYLGVIFAESPRQVSLERAGEIRGAVPRACLVGVFANADPATVWDAAQLSGLNMIQLHGNESPDYCAILRGRTLLPIVKTFRQGELPDPTDLALYRTVKFFLLDLDKQDPNRDGGVAELWAEAARVGQRGYSVFLAGGLAPANVRAAVKQTAPFCVDVCRGVERAPGIKDIEAVRRFITEVRG